jgi:hypothetical protein
MWPLYKKAREHPAVSVPLAALGGFVSLYLLAASLWASVYVDKAFLPTVWAAATSVTPTLSFGTVWMVILLAIFGLSVSVIGAVAVSAVQNKKMATRLQGEVDGLRGPLATAAEDNARLIAERDQAVVALKDKKHAYAVEILERCSNLRFKPDSITPVIPTVTIRYCSYGKDYELAQQIQTYFTLYAKWPVTLDGSNNPALPRADKFKVVFDVGMTVMTYGELVHAFIEGNLLGVSVGLQQFVDREDSHHLIVKVLPSTPSESI